MSVFDLLDEIRKRPTSYVGESNAERAKQLYNLDMLLARYGLALEQHGIEERVSSFHGEFGTYLRRRFAWSMSCGPIAAVRNASRDDDEAWERLWTLIEEFRDGLPVEA